MLTKWFAQAPCCPFFFWYLRYWENRICNGTAASRLSACTTWFVDRSTQFFDVAKVSRCFQARDEAAGSRRGLHRTLPHASGNCPCSHIARSSLRVSPTSVRWTTSWNPFEARSLSRQDRPSRSQNSLSQENFESPDTETYRCGPPNRQFRVQGFGWDLQFWLFRGLFASKGCCLPELFYRFLPQISRRRGEPFKLEAAHRRNEASAGQGSKMLEAK